MSDIARHFDTSKAADGGFIPGVPLADIDQATFDSLPPHVQQAVDASPLYRKTKPSSSTKAAKASDATADTPAKED